MRIWASRVHGNVENFKRHREYGKAAHALEQDKRHVFSHVMVVGTGMLCASVGPACLEACTSVVPSSTNVRASDSVFLVAYLLFP